MATSMEAILLLPTLPSDSEGDDEEIIERRQAASKESDDDDEDDGIDEEFEFGGILVCFSSVAAEFGQVLLVS
jgi:hypothetical protein